MNDNRLSLDVIEVAEPCTRPWEAMAGDERVRYCEGCHKHVHNLSAMSRGEAERLVCEAAGRLCVRFERAVDGRVQTLEYRAPLRKGRGWKFWTVASTCAASIVAGANAFFLGRPAPAPPVPAIFVGQPAPGVVLGRMAAPPTLPPAAIPTTLPGSPAATGADQPPTTDPEADTGGGDLL